jgi:hypothetical protein
LIKQKRIQYKEDRIQYKEEKLQSKENLKIKNLSSKMKKHKEIREIDKLEFNLTDWLGGGSIILC